MADEQNNTENTPNGGNANTAGKTFTQEELNQVITERLARERAKYQDYDDLKKTAETLAAEKKQREEEEAKRKGDFDTLEKTLKQENETLKSYKDKWESWEKVERERIEKAMESLTDSQKNIVKALPLESQMSAIGEFVPETKKPGIPPNKGGGRPPEGEFFTREEVEKMSMDDKKKNIDKINKSMKFW